MGNSEKIGGRRVLVTGGCGFIGSKLVERLIAEGVGVRVYDDFSRPYRYSNIPEIAQVVEGDVRDRDAVEKAVQKVDCVIHLAALTDVRESVKHPMLYYDVNATGTLNLLEASASQGVKKFVFSSSCAVYGRPARFPVDEETHLNPLSPYAASKAAAEGYCLSFAESRGLKCIVLRLFNVYGRMGLDGYSGVVSEFINRVIKDEPPVIFGTGHQSRDFIHISDVVECLTRAISLDPRISEILNLGTGKATSITQLAETIVRVSGKKGLKPIYGDSWPGEVDGSRADVGKLSRLIRYSPRVGLEEGLRILLESQMQVVGRC